VVAVVLDEPMIGRYGGDLAGPVFRRVAEASLRYLGVPPSNSAPKIKAVKREGDPADAMLAALAPPKDARPDGAEALGAPSGSPAAAPAPTVLGPPPPNTVRVPEASGLGARDAVRAVGAVGLVPLVEGTGRLVKQSPAAGSPVPKGTSVRLVFEPAS
jgi:cell division protein FtsI (penicillin-binding protein 3)